VFARYASVLQANRGGAAPHTVTDLAGRSANPAIEVTDAAGSYRAWFSARAIVPPGQPQPPSNLVQLDLSSNKAFVWVIDPTNGNIVPQPGGDPIETTYTNVSHAVGPGAPGSSTTPPPVAGPTVDP
jgi:hypothetical protein